jgi:hypothetical protein
MVTLLPYPLPCPISMEGVRNAPPPANHPISR